MKIIVTTYPFGESNEAKELLSNFDVNYNEVKRKYNFEEHQEVLKRTVPDIIIAGTEKYDSQSLDLCRNLKMISRVGVGLDSIDLKECQKRGIVVTYTPQAPSNAVAELTICQMLNSLRNVTYVHKIWQRYIGRDMRDCVVGIFGYGRIGAKVVAKLRGLEPREILINDHNITLDHDLPYGRSAEKEEILTSADIITLHIPLIQPGLEPTYDNHNFIDSQDLQLMKNNAIVINTSRGGVINEAALYDWLVKNTNAKAVIDTFENEPYTGDLLNLNNTFLTPHLGSCTERSRYEMEVSAVNEVLNFLNNKNFNNRII